MAIRICAYPRSGNNWLENRIRLFYFKCLGRPLRIPALHQQIQWSHLRFHFEGMVPEPSLDLDSRLHSNKNDSTSFLLRDAKSVLVSAYYFIRYKSFPWLPRTSQEKIDKIKKLGASSLEEFIRGDFGVKRYCLFLNQVNKYRHTSKKFIFYEDLSDKKSILDLPSILDENYVLSNDDIEFIYRNSDFSKLREGKIDKIIQDQFPNLAARLLDISTDQKRGIFRKGSRDGYKDDLSDKDIKYIDNFIKRECKLEVYTKYFFNEDEK